MNLNVAGGIAAGSAALPLRLLDGFSLYTEGVNGAEEIVGLEQLSNGERLPAILAVPILVLGLLCAASGSS